MAKKLNFDNIKQNTVKETYKMVVVEDANGEEYELKYKTRVSSNDTQKFLERFIKYFEDWQLDGSAQSEEFTTPIVSLNSALITTITDIEVPDNKEEFVAFFVKLVELDLVENIVLNFDTKVVDKLQTAILNVMDFATKHVESTIKTEKERQDNAE